MVHKFLFLFLKANERDSHYMNVVHKFSHITISWATNYPRNFNPST